MSDTDKHVADKAQGLIDENLKRVYADVESEELPDRFKDLLSKLKEQDAKSSEGQ